MKIYVAKITKTEKMVYLLGVRIRKENDKYNLIPFDLSVKPENYNLSESGFPIVADVKLIKGIGAIVKDYAEKV